MNPARVKPTEKTYTVAGKTLEAIWTQIEKKGPLDPNEGKRYAGSCSSAISIAMTNKDLAFEIKPGTPVEAKARVAEGKGTVTSAPAITLPKLDSASEKKLSADALKEWKRFLAATIDHEYGHADSLFLFVVEFAVQIGMMSAAATGADEKAAKRAAGLALMKKVDDEYGGTALADLGKAEIKLYDAQTRHGATQGAVLKTSIK
jgi:predicted secreted Zn-dependent protease